MGERGEGRGRGREGGGREGERGGGGGREGVGERGSDLGADLKAHRTPGVEHDGVPNNSADRPAMPCETRTPGPRQTLPCALGPGAVPWRRSAPHAERSQLRPEASPGAGARPPGPCPLSCRGPQHLP